MNGAMIQLRKHGFQSTRPGRSATNETIVEKNVLSVSIHAPRAERDHGLFLLFWLLFGFNPRAPGGARHEKALVFVENVMFQSTRPGRSATT